MHNIPSPVDIKGGGPTRSPDCNTVANSAQSITESDTTAGQLLNHSQDSLKRQKWNVKVINGPRII